MKLLPKARTAELVVQYLPDEILIYDLKIDQAYCLNETLAKVFNDCDGKTRFETLKSKYHLTGDTIFFALDELRRHDLLAETTGYVSPFSDLSRREVIRKVGLASTIALPIISSLVAPSAASAASGGSLNRVCTTDSDCGSDARYCTTEEGTTNKRCCRTSEPESADSGETVTKFIGSTDCGDCFKQLGRYCCSGRIIDMGFDQNSCNEPVPPHSCTAVCA